MKLRAITMCSFFMLLLTTETPASAGADDPEWVAMLTSGKLRCKSGNGSKFNMVATESGSLSGNFGPTPFNGSWKVVDANTWSRDIYWKNNSSNESQRAALNDDGSISLGPSTCRLKE